MKITFMINLTRKILSLALTLCVLGGSLYLSSCNKDEGVNPATKVVTGVTISAASVSVNSGATTQLTATIVPADATNQKVTWTSSNNAIATVSASGLVTGVASGIATITVTTDDGGKTATSKINVDFSDFTSEQDKSNLENNGIQVVNDVSAFKDEPALTTVASLVHFAFGSSISSGRLNVSNNAVLAMKLLAKFKAGQVTHKELMSGLRQQSDPSSPQEAWDRLAATYTYNFETNEFDSSASVNDALTIEFPSTEDGLDNNAIFRVYDFSSVTISNDQLEYDKDLPTSLKADLTVDGDIQLAYDFSASYKSNGEPEQLSSTLDIADYELYFDLSNSVTEISVNYGLTKSGNNIVSYGADLKGNFTSLNVNNAETPGDVINTATIYFQIADVKFTEEAQVKTIDDALPNDPTPAQAVPVLNADSKFWVSYADTGKKIAGSEFYVDSTSGEDQINIRLVFADGSKSDLETYTNEGFSDLQSKIDELLGN
jgi:hypothetical protein